MSSPSRMILTAFGLMVFVTLVVRLIPTFVERLMRDIEAEPASQPQDFTGLILVVVMVIALLTLLMWGIFRPADRAADPINHDDPLAHGEPSTPAESIQPTSHFEQPPYLDAAGSSSAEGTVPSPTADGIRGGRVR